jgi:glycosyltransferase involved in cell wall biosynthesis
MPGKSILIVTSELVPFHYGGIGTQFMNLASLLIRHNHQVSLLSRKPDNFDMTVFRSYYGEIPLFFVEIPSVKSGPPQHFIYAVEVARRFDEIYSEVRPDLVIVADFGAEGLLLLLQSVNGSYVDTEFLLTTQGMNHEVISVCEGNKPGISQSIKNNPDIRLLLAMEDLCVQLASRIVSPTICAWEEIRQRLGNHKTAQIIPNLINVNLFYPKKTKVQEKPQELSLVGNPVTRRQVPLSPEKRKEQREPLILFVGRLDRMKGTDLLLKSYFEIADQMEASIPRIIFIGRDCFWNDYNSTFLEYWKDRIPKKYRDYVSFLGHIPYERICDYLNRATVSVFPSRWEPFGIVCLEAMAMGCPVVVSQGTGFAEVLGPELAEFAVPVKEDVRLLTRKIMAVLRGDIQASSEMFQRRAREVVRQAEDAWLHLLQGGKQQEKKEDSGLQSVPVQLQRLLLSLEESWRGVAHLQIYFRHRGGYAEADSFRMSYPRMRWTTLKIPLPADTGERPLRLDPADSPGTVWIKQIILLDAAGNEIWRTDRSSRFHGCRIDVKNAWSLRKDCLVIESATDDPQIYLDCPVTDRLAELSIRLYDGDDLSIDVP